MSILFIAIAVIAAIMFLLINRVKLYVWLLIPGIYGVYPLFFGQSISLLSYLSLAVLLAVTAVMYTPSLRKKLITEKVFKRLRGVVPAISKTEQQAIQAGDVWWEGDLFQGNPNWQKILAMPKPTLSSEEEQFLNNQVTTLCKMIDDWKYNQELDDLPEEIWEYLKKERFFSFLIPKEYGGLEFSGLGNSAAVMKVATKSVSLAVTVMVPNSLGPGELLIKYGTQEQKSYYLPRLAKGLEIPCFALTGVEAGSDASSISDIGVITKGEFNGEEILGIELNFNKRYITLAPVASLIGLAFQLHDPDNHLGKGHKLGITLCLIPRNTKGIDIGRRHIPMRQKFMNGPIVGKNVFIPLDYIIGGAEQAGNGWKMLMECLSEGRGISLPALSAANAKVAYKTVGAYSMVRQQFRTSIGKFEGVAEAMAKIAGYTYAIESIRYFTANAISNGINPSIASAIAKYHMTEMGRKVINHSMDIHGGKAIIMGPSNYIANAYIATPVSITVEGANILTRSLIIFGQGALRCHPYLRFEYEALTNPDEKAGLDTFDKNFFKHIGYTLSNVARSAYYTITGARFIKTPENNFLRRYYQQITRMSTTFAVVSDLMFLMIGGKLKRLERISARLGDILSYLYISSAVIKYYRDFGDEAVDRKLVEWNLRNNLNAVYRCFIDVFNNAPIPKPVKWILKLRFFPFGNPYRKSTDAEEYEISQQMMQPDRLRARLTAGGAYDDSNIEDAIGKVEIAFTKMLENKELIEKMNTIVKHNDIPPYTPFAEKLDILKQNKLLSDMEYEMLVEFNIARLAAINVDSF